MSQNESHASAVGILFALSFCHLLNDAIQALIPAIYPLLKESFKLNFTQIGLITLTFQMVVGSPAGGGDNTDNRRSRMLVFGMAVNVGLG